MGKSDSILEIKQNHQNLYLHGYENFERLIHFYDGASSLHMCIWNHPDDFRAWKEYWLGEPSILIWNLMVGSVWWIECRWICNREEDTCWTIYVLRCHYCHYVGVNESHHCNHVWHISKGHQKYRKLRQEGNEHYHLDMWEHAILEKKSWYYLTNAPILVHLFIIKHFLMG